MSPDCPHCDTQLKSGVPINSFNASKGYSCTECETTFTIQELTRLGVL